MFCLGGGICFDRSLELSRQDCSNDGSQHAFGGVLWKAVPDLPLVPFLVWSAGSDIKCSLVQANKVWLTITLNSLCLVL